MPVAAVIATALTNRAYRAALLTVGGRDVLADPSKRYSVPLESIEVNEAGPGDVSSMSFVIEDYGLTVNVADGNEVRFHNIRTGQPMFLGWVQAWNVTPDFGDQGRTIAVQAVGIEAVLDWAIIPSALTVLTGTSLGAAFQTVLSAAIGLDEMRWALNTVNVPPTPSSQAVPLGATPVLLLSDVAIPAGTSVRGALNLLTSAVNVPSIGL